MKLEIRYGEHTFMWIIYLKTAFKMIAKHVMNIHMNRPNINGDEDGNAVGEIDLDKMKAYIAYCKRCAFVSCFPSW